jgi:Ni,Fe-hydrogenase I cytochrome b subunit
MLIVIIFLQAVDSALDGRPICDRIPRAVKVLGPLVVIFLFVVTMLVVITGMRMMDSNVTDDTVAILNFTENVMAVVVALVANNVMVRAVIACDVVMTLVMLFIALAFGLIAVVGSLSIIDQLRFR